ncbi:MAG: choice-of-anchor J domain-containing protein [Bacteroidales bacterium]|nr:choice-of-anchor J domain-containing protein [Bacteroidales bacterium]
MKKYFILSVLALVAMSAFAQGRIDMRSESKAEITRSDFTSLNAVFSYGAIESAEISTTRGIFSEIAIEGTYPSGEIGTPQLPASHQLLAVPFGATPSVNIISYTMTDYCLSDYGIKTLLPHQPSIRKDQRPEDVEFVYEAFSYQTRSLATAPEATIEMQGTLRGIRIGSLVVNPVSYNPTSNTLRVFNDIEVEVRFEGADLAETERMLLSTYSPYFDIVYQQMFNYRQILDVYTDHPDLMAYPVHMIVIAPQNYTTALQPWVNWKIQKGFDVNVYTTSQTGTSYSAIRSYVQNLYNTGVSQGKTPTFLILVGDVAQIPATTGSSSEKVTDLYYGSVDGDYFPDMFYSRMSAENTTQLTSIINKILQYEQYTMADPSYLNKVLLIAGQDNYWNPVVAQPTINYATTYYYNTAHGFSNVYAYLNSYSGCYNNLSTGVGFANYTAHGSETGWSGPAFSNSNVNSLTNTNKYFLAMGNCCLTGNFGYSSACFGEAMIRAENKGAYSYIGSCPVTYWYEDFYFGVGAHNTHGGPTPSYTGSSTGCYDGIWMDDTYNTVSSMVFLGNLAVCYAHTGGYQTHSTPLYYWQAYHVLGDGSIMPYRVNPTANNVSHGTTFPAGATSFTVTAEAGSYVGISQNNVLKGAALVPSTGIVNVPVTPVTSGQVKIVVTKPQRQPYIQTLNVAGGTVTHTVTIQADPAEGGTVAFGNKGQREDITYDFEADFTAQQILDWTVIDADGDGYGWYIRPTGLESLGHNGSQGFVTSASYQEVPLTPDNYLVSPQGQYSSISFWACAQDAAWPQEHFGVAVSTTNGTSPSAFTTIQEWDMTAKRTGNRRERGTNELGTYYEYTVDLSAYAGQDIYVAIRHFNCTDWFRLNVDDITLSTVAVATPITAIYDHGTSCTVTATPSTGYNFVNWTENGNVVSSSANYTFTVNDDRTLVANFSTEPQPQPEQYTINVSADPAVGGTVTGGGTYDEGSSCTVTATANTDYDFENWTENGTVVSTNASYTFTVNGDRNLVAHFSYEPQPQPEQYTITLTANPVEGGEVSGGGTYDEGTPCTAIATANTGYLFDNWTENGTVVSTNAHYSFNVTGDRELVANFSLEPQPQPEMFTINVSAQPADGGTVTGGGTYEEGTSCTVSADANDGYNFVNWTENGFVISTNADYSFTVTGNRNLVAHFEQITFTITASAGEFGSITPAGDITVAYGGSQHFEMTPDYDCEVLEVLVDGISVGAVTEYTFEEVTSDHTIHVTFNQTLGTDETEAQALVVYPNPTSGQFKLANHSFNEVRVYNTLGVMVLSLNSNGSEDVEIDLSGQPNGIYFLQVSDNHQSITKRIVKMN